MEEWDRSFGRSVPLLVSGDINFINIFVLKNPIQIYISSPPTFTRCCANLKASVGVSNLNTKMTWHIIGMKDGRINMILGTRTAYIN